MYRKSLTIIIWATLIALPGLAKQVTPAVIDTLAIELQRLTLEKNKSREALETSEAERWQSRYNQSRVREEKEEILRKLEARYTSEASIQGQKQENLIRATNTTQEKKAEWEDAKSKEEGFKIQISQEIDQLSKKLGSDFPYQISLRTQELSNLGNLAEENQKQHLALKGLLDYQLNRLNYTYTQSLITSPAIFSQQELKAKTLRLGTVWMGAVSEENNKAQLLLRSGRLDGNVFVWRDNLSGQAVPELFKAVRQASLGDSTVKLPLDVLQNKSLSSGFIEEDQGGIWSKFINWFKLGGIVMYPLALSALLGFFLCLDRYIVIVRKSINPKSIWTKITPHIESKEYQKASDICVQTKTSMGNLFAAVFIKAQGERKGAEKALRESLMKEVPNLEKRMLMISAIGGAAPLMGLLGTVSGMISLFKVITDVGTNDPRILAAGISEALITTQTGLMIAIPILLIQGYLNDRLDKIQNDMSTESAQLLNVIWPEQNKGQ